MADLGRTGVIVAARSGSTRLPGKALLPLAGIPMIAFLLRRLKGARHADVLLLATTELTADDALAEVAAAEGVPVFRGAEDDLIDRFVAAAEAHDLDTVVRVTADCPFVDAQILDYCLASCAALEGFDIATTKGAFPVGLDFEIYRAAAMAGLRGRPELSAADREHLTKHIYDHPERYGVAIIEPRNEWRLPDVAFTVDTAADYRFAQDLTGRFDGVDFSVAELVDAVRRAA